MSTDSRPASSRSGSQPGGGWIPPTVEELQALLPQYEITAMLGHGGMGAVYKGRQKSLDRVVAIKILPPGLENSDAKFVERFQNEARTMAKLMHPGIVAVFDFGETAEGQLYFVMEYVDGTDVAKMIQSSGKLPQDYALAITAHVCDALAYAHGFGVVHRDIKPANILINMQGQIKVADFGLAKADDPAQTSGLTKTGYAMGTPDYVSPEALIMGSSIDGRADLYAIGVMLYQMLTGEIPRGLFQMPNVRTKGETDPRFDAIISKAMQTDREARYQTAGELRKALDVILTTPHIKQDASKAVAAVPQQAVAETPGKRSAVAAKPGAKGPKPPQQAPPNHQSPISDSKAKSNAGLWLGIAAAVVVIIGAAVYLTSGGKPDVSRPSKIENPASADSTLESRATSPKPKPSTPVSTPTPKLAAIAQSNSADWIDGLAEWLEKPENAAQSTLQKEGTAWRYKGPQAIGLGARLSPPNTLANVAVRYSVRLDTKNSSANILLRTQKAAGSFYQVTVYGSGVAGMALVKDGQLTELAHSPKLPGFDETAAHVIEFRAEGDKLTLLVDGVERGSVNDSTYASGGFSVARGLIDKIEYRDLGTSPAMPVVAGAGSDGWIDGLAEWLALPGNSTKKTLQKEADGWRYKGPQSIGLGARLSPPYQLANVAVRLTSKGGGGSIGLRSQGGAGNHYLAVQSYPNFVEIRRGQNNEYTTLAKFRLPPGFKQGDSYVMEFRAEGEVLTLMVNGQTLGSIKDSTYSSGKFHVAPLYALIEKLEYRDLGSAAVVAESARSSTVQTENAPPGGSLATSATSGGWIDGLAEWLAVPGNADGGIMKEEAGAWRILKGESVRLGSQSGKPRKTLANLAVRVSAPTPAGYLVINLRGIKDAGGYSATLLKDGKSQISESNRPMVGAQFAQNADFDAGARHVMEFRAVGDVLTLIIDGRTVGSVKGSRFSDGNFSVNGSVGTVIEKIEYRDLGSAAVVAESARSSTVQTRNAPPGGSLATSATPPTPTDPKLTELLPNYTKAITNGLASATAADKPAFEAELARLKNNAPLPDAAEDAKLPAELKRLRGILREQLK